MKLDLQDLYPRSKVVIYATRELNLKLLNRVLFNTNTAKTNELNKQNNYTIIKLFRFLPEEYRAELKVLSKRWIDNLKLPKWCIKFMIAIVLLDMLWGSFWVIVHNYIDNLKLSKWYRKFMFVISLLDIFLHFPRNTYRYREFFFDLLRTLSR